MGEFVKVAGRNDVPAGRGMKVEAGGKQIALFNVDGRFYAIDDACTHVGGPLSAGKVEGTEVTCPLHGAAFDVTTGKVLAAPAPDPVSCYQVRVAGDDIEIEV